jgi:hypothetical protein
MKLAGLLPLRLDTNRSTKLHSSLRDLSFLCDEVFVLSDNSPAEYVRDIQAAHPDIFSWTVINSNGPVVWNDWSNRAILLLEAARNGYEWVWWIDHDETLWPSPDRSLIDDAIAEARKNPTVVCVRYPWLQLWENPETVRVDGFWATLKKPFLHKNPFCSNLISWPTTCAIPLHSFPIQHGACLIRKDLAVLHWGMMSRTEREYRVNKYRSQDPSGKTDDMFMDSLKEESSAATVRLSEINLETLP